MARNEQVITTYEWCLKEKQSVECNLHRAISRNAPQSDIDCLVVKLSRWTEICERMAE